MSTTLDPDIKVLRAKRREALPDHIVDEDDNRVDRVTEDGERINEIVVDGGGGTTETHNSSLTSMYRPAPSTTGDVDILVLEAELLADGADLENPHIPETEAIRDKALDRLDGEGLEPAWRAADD